MENHWERSAYRTSVWPVSLCAVCGEGQTGGFHQKDTNWTVELWRDETGRTSLGPEHDCGLEQELGVKSFYARNVESYCGGPVWIGK